MNCVERLQELILLSLGDFPPLNRPPWRIEDSKIAGRGVFAARKIECGEIIFEEAPLIIGSASRNEGTLSYCSICYSKVSIQNLTCEQGCGLPVCVHCLDQHQAECKLFKSWEPVEPQTPNVFILRLLTAARSMMLNSSQTQLLYFMQANSDPIFRKEIKSSTCFRKMTSDKNVVDHLSRTVEVLNTNAFVVNSDSDCPLRALYPLGGIVNHECVPNSTYTFEGKNHKMILKATKQIREDEEVTISYTKLLWSNVMRRLYLRMTKNFVCKCQRCLDPTVSRTLKIFLLGLF